MKKTLQKLASLLCLALVLNLSFMSVACDEKTQVEKVAKAAVQLTGVIEDAETAVRSAYEQKLISFELKNKAAWKLKALDKGSEAFIAMAKEYRDLYKDGKIPPDKRKLIEAALSDKILQPFTDLIETITGVNTPPELRAAIAVLRSTITAIASVFGRTATPFVSPSPVSSVGVIDFSLYNSRLSSAV